MQLQKAWKYLQTKPPDLLREIDLSPLIKLSVSKSVLQLNYLLAPLSHFHDKYYASILYITLHQHFKYFGCYYSNAENAYYYIIGSHVDYGISICIGKDASDTNIQVIFNSTDEINGLGNSYENDESIDIFINSIADILLFAISSLTM